MSEIVNAQIEEIDQNQQAQSAPVRRFSVEMIFTESGIEINTHTNLTPLEQMGAVELFKANILNQNKENAQ